MSKLRFLAWSSSALLEIEHDVDLDLESELELDVLEFELEFFDSEFRSLRSRARLVSKRPLT